VHLVGIGQLRKNESIRRLLKQKVFSVPGLQGPEIDASEKQGIQVADAISINKKSAQIWTLQIF
jgi:hypothetical protein